MTLTRIAEFAAASVALALTPGPDIITVITRSVTQGVRTGIIATLGFASGCTVHTTAAALGVAVILRASPRAMLSIQLFGAAYLFYLAARTMLSRQAFSLEANGDNRGLRQVFAQSALMNILNPKVTLFFLSLLIGFADNPDTNPTPPTWIQMIILGGIFALCTILVFGSCAIFAGGISGWLRSQQRAQKYLRWATAALFAGIATYILFVSFAAKP